MLLQEGKNFADASRKLGQRANGARDSYPLQTADFDELQRKSGGWDELGFKARACTDEYGMVAARLQFARDREQWDYVASRAASRHHDRRHPKLIRSVH